jgi:hypothetical protein
MTADKRQAILRKIKACFALAGGAGTEAEAQAALDMAHGLMAKYHLSRVEVDGFDAKKNDMGEWVAAETKSRPLEVMAVFRVIQTVFPVQTWEAKAEATSQFTYSRKYIIFGWQSDVEVATYAFHYLRRTFRKLWQTRRHELKAELGYTPKRPDMRAYYNGLARGMCVKLKEHEKRTDCTALVRTGALVREEAYRRYEFGKAREAGLGSYRAAQQGYEDGQRINLRQGVTGSRQGELT